ncbi:uncharacterized protein RBU33_008489 [Hipposideros larvatus]
MTPGGPPRPLQLHLLASQHLHLTLIALMGQVDSRWAKRTSAAHATGRRGQLPPSHTLLCDHSGLGATCFLLCLSAAQDRGMEPVSSPLTTHVLDTVSGLPTQGLCLQLSRLEDHGQQWKELRKRYGGKDGTEACPTFSTKPQYLRDRYRGLRTFLKT